MNLSYWEYKTWLANVDFTIVGSGIVGLNCALNLRNRFPKAKILILEKGILPQGASTKNAGFACFGSISEILSDLKNHSEEEVLQLVKKRWEGIQLLRQNLSDVNIDFQCYAGHEMFLRSNSELYENCLEQLKYVNDLLKPVFGDFPFQKTQDANGFKKIQENYVSHIFEGQLDTGKLMETLLQKTRYGSINILNSVTVEEFSDLEDQVAVKTNIFDFKTKKLFIATNGFASQLVNQDVRPARAQVLITKPIPNLHIKGAFHLVEGYYYFRNIDGRILLGGGRNLDFIGEETTVFGKTQLIQTSLEDLLKEVILPDTPFEIESRWSGIMGVGKQKRPIVKQLSNNVLCGVRLGGMGIAIGSTAGKELAELI